MEGKNALSPLERRALHSAISGIQSESVRDCLLKQAQGLRVISRQDNRPHGFYTYFRCAGALPISLSDGEINKNPPATWGLYGGTRNPISFVVYVKNGLIDFMEASSTISEWPEREELITFSIDTQQREN